MFLHELEDVSALYNSVSEELGVQPQIVEKDYWLMHSLWGLQQCGFSFELKGGTSLSKGYDLIHRFSEDVDIKIFPDKSLDIKTGKNHSKPAHVESRKKFFNQLVEQIQIPGIVDVSRETEFDDPRQMRNAGVRLTYQSVFSDIPGLKSGILLEVGFDTTTPNEERNITSWAFDKASDIADIEDNRANGIKCYCPEYTLVEKLQAVSTKYRQFADSGKLPTNFIRHYYDIHQLLGSERVINFIGTDEYYTHKSKRFRQQDEKDITKNEAFWLNDPQQKEVFYAEYKRTSALYYKDQPDLDEILSRIQSVSQQL